jgi:hypothetical protein
LLAGIPDHERAKQLVRRHLLNERKFWGEFAIPAISKNDPAFRDQLYWRSRIWGSVNYLVYLGLKAYRFDGVAFDLALRSMSLFMQEWNLIGIRFGCRFLPEETSLTNVPFGGSIYSIKTSLREARACRDNKEFFFSSQGVSA